MQRKLVTIRKIDKILPIKGKDVIAQAFIGGWSLIVKKEEFEEGDLCIFFEIDSFLPDEPRYSFMKPTTYKGKQGYRIKTMKMAGVLSQGLALPLSMFLKDREWNDSQPFSEGDDVTELAKVTKYDVAEVQSLRGNMEPGAPLGKFPHFIPKTDQERIQNLSHYFETLKDMEFEETLKLDGSSMTCYKVDKPLTKLQQYVNTMMFYLFRKPLFKETAHFGVCSRNLEIKPTDNYSTTFDNGNGKISTYNQSNFWQAAVKYGIESKLPKGYAIQGELIAPNIQSNHEKVSDMEYYVFDVYDIDNQRYLTSAERHDFCLCNDINHVPILNSSIKIFEVCPTQDALLKRVEGQSMNPGTISEGRVYKCTTNPDITFKAISNKYLLKCEE